jgi:outer membrane immunogenic protein
MRLAFTIGLLAAALIASAPAFAADMPVKAAPMVGTPTWTGTYIGINGGWGGGTTNHIDIGGVGSPDFGQNGGVAGITYGGNWQAGQWVLGFESDLDWADIKGTLTTAPAGLCSVAGGNTCFTTIKSISTERMRAGIDLQGWLLFGTAGAAFARVDAGQNPCGGVPGSCNEKWRTGWVAGLGVEKMFLPNWSAKLEYLHFDLGSDIQYNPGVPVRVLERGDMVRLGINYHFDFISLLHLN